MSLNASAAPSLPSAPATHAAPSFFGYHGLLSPGVRLFRSIGFQAKATWVSVAFLLPVLVLSWSLWSTASDSIAFSAKEHVGIDCVRALMPLLDAEQHRRRAAVAQSPDLPQWQARVAALFTALQQTQQQLGAELKTTASFERVRLLQASLADAPTAGTTASTFAAHTALIDATMGLLEDVADGSNLTLDPDVDTFYLMDAALFRQPQLIEQFGRLRGMGNAVLRGQALDVGARDLLSNSLAFATVHQTNLEKSLQRAIDADPTIANAVSMQQVVDGGAAYQRAVRDQLLGAAPSGDAAAFVEQANQIIAANYALNGQLLDALDQRIAARIASLQHTLMLQLSIAAAGIAVAMYLLMAFYRVTQGGIREVARQLEEISKGNLSLRPRPWGRDEVALLMNTLAAMLESLRRTVSGVRDSAGEIEVASGEVAAASLDLSRRTEDTAAHLQRTASAMTQIGGTVRQTAATAEGASDLIGRNAAVAVDGGRIVSEVVESMGGIRASSSRIADIIGTIDGIAFQTNILALNAAVEAARAGEQGRGFAVVASEVRALAQRSGAAAREIKALIGDSVDNVTRGTRVVGEAGGTMEVIVGNADRIKLLMSEISDATAGQTSGLEDVGRSVEQLDAMTQQNAALVEQTAAAAATLRGSAERLTREMAYFRVS